MKENIKELIADIFSILEEGYEDRTHNTYATTVNYINLIRKRLRQIETLIRKEGIK